MLCSGISLSLFYASAGAYFHIQREVTDSDYPFIVSVRFVPPSHVTSIPVCVGTLMSLDVVLTSCSCIEENKYEKSGLQVRAGNKNYYLKRGVLSSQDRAVANIWKMPGCKRKAVDIWIDDIIFLKLILPFQETEFVKKANLFSTDVTTLFNRLLVLSERNGTVCRLFGWGATDESMNNNIMTYTKHKNRLNEIGTALLPTRQCANDLCKYNQGICPLNAQLIRDRGHFCANILIDEIVACKGDRGAPILCDGHVWGILSYTVKCGDKLGPQIFTGIDEVMKLFNAKFKSSSVKFPPIDFHMLIIYVTTIVQVFKLIFNC